MRYIQSATELVPTRQCPRPVVQRFNQKPYISTTTFQHDDAGFTWHCSASSSPLSMTTYPAQYPTAVAEVAITAQLERLRVTEAVAARDNVVSAIISRLDRELEILRQSSVPSPTNPSARQDIQYSESCAGAEYQTDDEKGVYFERHVREIHPGILSSACRFHHSAILAIR
ncbi:hypothetical protein EDD15DRAFT_1025516 [Pisolithus albus]|nr:hypothetical protein EDD15DRAFT_1025516 [Pisolithus albus]